MTLSSLGRPLAATLLILLAAVSARADDPPGVLWETTSQMVMEGMPMSMPQRTLKVCTAKEWKKPPPGGDKSCESTDFQRDGNKATWTMQCSGEMPMKGTGEMTFESDDSYTGAIKATADGMNMTIRLSGKKIGTCDKPLG
jgi:hypothetical protein